MCRLLYLLTVVLLLAPSIGSAPKLKDVPVPVYYPTTVGDRCGTVMQANGATETVTDVVAAIEVKDGSTVVSVIRDVDGVANSTISQMRVTTGGNFRVSTPGTVFDAPYCVLKLPFKAGETWTSEASKDGVTLTTFKYKAVMEEDIEVPAGKYRAIRIDVEMDSQGQAGKSSIWYAPRVGVVRQEHESGNWKYTKVLKSFTPGK